MIGQWSSTARGIKIDSVGNVGIGMTAPTARLEIDGQIRIRGGTPAAGSVLTSDGTGLAVWAAPATGQDNITINWITRHRHFFVTASTFNGNLGGLSGADSRCNADTNRLPGRTYHAVRADDITWNAPGVGLFNSLYGETVNLTRLGGNQVCGRRINTKTTFPAATLAYQTYPTHGIHKII